MLHNDGPGARTCVVGGAQIVRICIFLLTVMLAGCTAPRPAREAAPPIDGDRVTLLDHGWHTDIGVSAQQLSGPVAVFREIFPGASSLVFSFGKRTFLMAPASDLSEYILGPFPGPAAIMVTGLAVPPDQAYGSDESIILALPPGGAARLSNFLWQQIVKDPLGQPQLIGPGAFPGSLFYQATDGYALTNTCNAWSAAALAAAGLPIDTSGIVFAYQVMGRARALSFCPMAGQVRSP